jgi:DNA-binding GntR family transcriptional regulator
MPNRNPKQEQDEVLQKFENLILTGVFKPRERVVEADLAQRLNVSRYWVRDALKILENKGLVKIIPFKGAVVSDLSEKEINNIFAIRVALEQLAIRLGVERLRKSDIQALKKLAVKFERKFRDNNIQEMIQVNSEFHDYIFRLSDNPTLVRMIVDMRSRLHIIRYAAWSSPEALTRIIAEHQDYIEALERRDIEALDQLAERHISYSKNHYLKQLKTTGESL